jgi:hypothetical protein
MEKPKMIVNWKKEKAGLLTVSKMIKGVIVKTISILPGHNEINDDDWEGIKGQLQSKIDEGHIEVVAKEVVKEIELENGKTKTKKSTATKLAELEPDQALEIVQNTFDIKTLQKWRKSETRDEIRAAVADQIEFVKNPNPNKKKDE